MEITTRKVMSEHIVATHTEQNLKLDFNGTINESGDLSRIEGNITPVASQVSIAPVSFSYNESEFVLRGSVEGLTRLEATTLVVTQIEALRNLIANPVAVEEVV